MRGVVSIHQNGKLIHRQKNTVSTDLYEHLRDRLDSNSIHSMSLPFPEYNPDNNFNNLGKDGILYVEAVSDDFAPIPTSFLTAPALGAIRVRGVFIPEENIAVSGFRMGSAFASGDPGDPFQKLYASVDLPAVASYIAEVPVSITWDIYINRA